MCLSFLGGVCFSCAMIEGNSVVYSILLHSINNLVSVLLGSAQMSSNLDRVIERVIMFPIIFYLCEVSLNTKTKSQYMCLIYKQQEYLICIHCRNNYNIIDNPFDSCL